MVILSQNSFKAALPLLVLALLVPVRSQDEVDAAIRLALDGNVAAAAKSLSAIQGKYPGNGSVLFLEALITQDGEAAVELYRRIAQSFPSDPYADDAILKIGEYLYARGLYIQAAQQLRRIPIHYPRSDLVYPSIRLFLNSMIVAGDRDTARFYAQVFSKKYPDITFDLAEGRATSVPNGKLKMGSAPRPPRTNGVSSPDSQPSAPEKARLQVGAFRIRENAVRLKAQLEALNYPVRIVSSESDGRNIYVVMVVGFTSVAEAKTAGELLKEHYGMDYLVYDTK